MATNKKTAGLLLIDDDLLFEKRYWIVQKIGWSVIAVFLILSALGFSGSGPINADTASKGVLQIKYTPFVRQLTDTNLNISVRNNGIRNGEFSFWIDENFLDNYKIEKITPEPESVYLEEGRVAYQINARDMGEGGEIRFDLSPRRSGYIYGAIGQGDSIEINFRQFAFP